MSSNRTMTTEEIKKGLENIKRAQLQVLRQLRGDSFILEKQPQNSQSNIRYPKTRDNDQNLQINANVLKSSNLQTKNERYTTKISSQINQSFNQTKSVRTNQSLSTNSSSAQLQIQTIRKQFSSERQQLKNKLAQITNKVHFLQKESLETKNKEKLEQGQRVLKAKLKDLEQQKYKIQNANGAFQRRLEELEGQKRRFKSQLELKNKQKTILQTQIKSLKAQNTKLQRINKQLESSFKEQSLLIKDIKHQKQAAYSSQNKFNFDLLMKQVKFISNSHDFLFQKLKQSSKLQMTWISKQSQIQTSFSKLLEYLEIISQSTTLGQANYFKEQNINLNYKRQQSNQNIRNSMLISESRDQQRQQLEYFVRQIGQNPSTIMKKQKNSLKQENENLKKRIKDLTVELATFYSNNPKLSSNRNGISNTEKQDKLLTQSNRLVSLQLEEMRQEVAKLKKYKLQLKQQQQEQQIKTQKQKILYKQLQEKLQKTERTLTQTSKSKFVLDKKCHEQQIEISMLNSLIKQLNSKVNQQNQSSSLSQLRQQFAKLLQTNCLIVRQKESLKAMNEGLQVQVHNLKYEKQQFEANNKQKHELIERQIKQRNYLLEEISKKQIKTSQLKQQIEKLKNTLILNEQTAIKMRKHLQDLLQQKNSQVVQLRKQIEQLYKQSRQLHQLKFKYDKLQMEYKQLSRKSVKMGETLAHLWSVKQAEYHNVNQILGMLKNHDQSHNLYDSLTHL